MVDINIFEVQGPDVCRGSITGGPGVHHRGGNLGNG